MYTLPDDAPGCLVSLLEHWQSVSRKHPPTQTDFMFDELVAARGGLFLAEPVKRQDGQDDVRYIRVGPEHQVHSRRELSNGSFSDTTHPNMLTRVIDSYIQVMQTGQPQYWEFVNTVYGSPPVEVQRLLLPLYDDKGVFDCFLGECIWCDPA